jgi:hypothetical protein
MLYKWLQSYAFKFWISYESFLKLQKLFNNFMFEFQCIISLYYIKNQQDAIWAVTHDMHQWLLLQFLVLLMMDAESVWNM